MANAEGAVRVCRHGSSVVFQVEGKGTATHSLPLRRCAEEALASGVNSLRVDLRQCMYMDSTFLGTLFLIKKAAAGRGDFAIVSASPVCCRLMRQMGMDGLFVFVEAEPVCGDWKDLLADCGDVNSFRQNVLQAHQQLAELPGPTGATFREVVRGLTPTREPHCPS
jgi:anti-sigma B factor antagonist